MKKGYIYITSSGYDPEHGKNIKDPYLGETPTLGACMPNIRRQVVAGDQIFVISGKLRNALVPQYIVGGFEVAERITAMAAFRRFPHLRLRRLGNGELDGNIIVDSRGRQHPLDDHDGFAKRIDNYVVGCDPVALTKPNEIARGRDETVDVLRQLFGRFGSSAFEIVGRCSRLDENQILELRDWLYSLKRNR